MKTSITTIIKTITIDCDECVMQATSACDDCLVTHMLDTRPGNASPGETDSAEPGPSRGGRPEAIVLDLAEHRAVRWFAEAGLVPTLRHRAASNT